MKSAMVISPLEQFNVLSLHDFSLASISQYEIIYARILLSIWSIFLYCPLLSEGALPWGEGISDFLPILWASMMAFAALVGVALSGILYIIHTLSTWAYKLSFSLIDVSVYIDAFFNLYYSSLLFLWHSLYTNLDVLYATNANYISTLLPMGAPETSAWIHTNLGFLTGSAGASVFFILSVACFKLSGFISSFTIDPLLNLSTKDLSYLILSLNTSTIWLLLGFSFVTFLFTTILTRVTLLAKNHWQTILEALYTFILGVVNENAGPKGIKHFPLIFTTFMLILICNVLGMIPYSFTVTSHLIVTFSTALAIFIGINIIGILKNRKHFLSLFFPPGAPLALAPLLVFIELVSYVFRVLSLAIRLFANLMSGHTLLKILSSFGWAAVSFWGLFFVPLAIIFLITGLEIAIACLQAYIFSVLLCIYINDAFNLH
jgi:ATP synthase subunit 6